MKNAMLLIGLAIAAAGTALQAQTLDKGTRELAIAGNGDFSGSDDWNLYLEPKFGYFVADDVELGLSGNVNLTDDSHQFSIGPFAEYNFRTGSKWVPFITGGFEWINADIDIELEEGDVSSDSDAVAFGAGAGIKYFIADNIAISTKYTHEWASDDVFTSVDEVKDSAGFWLIGMRFYY